MIVEDIVYIRVDNPEEALAAREEALQGKPAGEVKYLSGGTELVSAGRRGVQHLDTLIDLKGCAGLSVLENEKGLIRFGAALSLNAVRDSNLFPLLSRTIRHIADRTVRNRLSLGGNIAGSLPYREAVLPLLLADAAIVTIVPRSGGTTQRRKRALRDVFDKRLLLEPGELVICFELDEAKAAADWRHFRRTRTATVDYPLVTACFLGKGTSKGLAVSGLHPFPVYVPGPIDDVTIDRLLERGPARDDSRGSGEYRLALLTEMIRQVREEAE